MFDHFKEHLNEILVIAESCPEAYKVPCFRILASELVRSSVPQPAAANGRESASPRVLNGGASIFVRQYDLEDHDISRVYHHDGDAYSIIVRDLKVKPKSQKQLRLALLLGAGGLLAGVDGVVEKQVLMELCKKYAAFDSANFAANIRDHRDLLLAKGDAWVLTVPGQERASEVIKELAS